MRPEGGRLEAPHLPRQPRHHPRRSAGGRGHVALLRRGLRQRRQSQPRLRMAGRGGRGDRPGGAGGGDRGAGSARDHLHQRRHRERQPGDQGSHAQRGRTSSPPPPSIRRCSTPARSWRGGELAVSCAARRFARESSIPSGSPEPSPSAPPWSRSWRRTTRSACSSPWRRSVGSAGSGACCSTPTRPRRSERSPSTWRPMGDRSALDLRPQALRSEGDRGALRATPAIGRKTPAPCSRSFTAEGTSAGLRSGTLPVPLIVGFGRAVALCVAEMDAEAKRLLGLRGRMLERLSESLAGVLLNGHPERRLPGNLNLCLRGHRGRRADLGSEGGGRLHRFRLQLGEAGDQPRPPRAGMRRGPRAVFDPHRPRSLHHRRGDRGRHRRIDRRRCRAKSASRRDAASAIAADQPIPGLS